MSLPVCLCVCVCVYVCVHNIWVCVCLCYMYLANISIWTHIAKRALEHVAWPEVLANIYYKDLRPL